ncbi:MAG TPA: DinB family protein [Bryobacteraceae bacterium]|nr:DinB family protein [Bryobacteraceae bacterium]
MIANTSATATAVAEPTLTAGEKERALLYLEQTRSGLRGALRNLSDAQWNFKPNSTRWSIAEIVEHVVYVQERVLGPIWDQLTQAPPAPPHADYKQVDELVIARFPNRLNKFPSPVQPSGRVPLSSALQRLLANYDQFNKRLEVPELRQHSIEAAPMKAVSNGAYQSMDGYQWILAVAAHTERHTKQILEVMAEPDYPA